MKSIQANRPSLALLLAFALVVLPSACATSPAGSGHDVEPVRIESQRVV